MWRGVLTTPLAALPIAVTGYLATLAAHVAPKNADSDDRLRLRNRSQLAFGHSSPLLCESAEIVRERRRVRKRMAGLLHCDPNKEIEQEYDLSGNSVLGAGQHGTVMVGVHRPTGKEHAVKKVALPLFEENKARMKAVALEVAILRQVSGNPYVVDFIDCCIDNDAAYIVMERGTSDLFAWMEAQTSDGRRPDEADVSILLRQMAMAVHHCHKRGVLYQDVKLENFVRSVDDERGVKLIDFSCSEFLEKVDQKNVVGTRAYLAPEVRYRQKSEAMDVWGLGVSFFVMLTGCSPNFSENYDMTDATLHTLQTCTPGAQDLCRKMLNKTPGRRITFPEVFEHPFLKAE